MRTLVGEGAEQEGDADSLRRRERHMELCPRSETPNRQSHPGAPSINLMTSKRGQENEIFQFIKELRKTALHGKSSAENEHGQRDREWPSEEAPVHIPGPSGRADLVPREGDFRICNILGWRRFRFQALGLRWMGKVSLVHLTLLCPLEIINCRGLPRSFMDCLVSVGTWQIVTVSLALC